MNLDDYQKAWQAESSLARVIVDADLLRQEVLHKEQEFRRTIFLRDCTEIGVAALLLPYWLYAGMAHPLPWTWFLGVPALLWVGGFMLVYRVRHRPPPGSPDEPLRASLQRSLREVEDQIWLLRNVLWWYLLPPGIAIEAFFLHCCWNFGAELKSWWIAGAFGLALTAFLLAVYAWVYAVNQRAVQRQLEPQRRELLSMLGRLGDEHTTDGKLERVALPSLPFASTAPTPWSSRRRVVIRLTVFALLGLSIVALMVVLRRTVE